MNRLQVELPGLSLKIQLYRHLDALDLVVNMHSFTI